MSRPVVILLFVAIYVALAFGLRSYLHYRRTGSTGFRGVSGRPLSLEWTGGVMFVLAMIATVAAPLLVWAGIEHPLLASSMARDVAGGVALGAGTLALLWSQGAMGTSWRIGVDQHEVTGLVTAGPFAVVRNPIFSAMLFSVLGLALLLPTVTALAAFTLLLLAVELQVRFVEEPYLLRTHGDAYRSYAHRVGRFVPGLGRRAIR
jgi:protein-S-isoprenylcysteine O-methyltransferase Ste14